MTFVDCNLDRFAINISWLATPLLTFSLVRWQLDNLAIAEVKCLVSVHECLNIIFTGWDIADFSHRKAERGIVNRLLLARCPAIDIHSKNKLCFQAVANLESRLRLVVVGEQQE